MATEEGIVTALHSTTACVKTKRTGACESCASKDACATLGGGQEMEVQVINPVGARVGDRVVIGFKTESLIRVSLLLYIFPIFSMILGAVIGHKLATIVSWNRSGFSAVFGFLFLFFAFVIVKFTGDKLTKKDKYHPKIIRILT